jgi:hypothetical protein
MINFRTPPSAGGPVPIHSVLGGGEAAGAVLAHHVWTTYLSAFNPYALAAHVVVRMLITVSTWNPADYDEAARDPEYGRSLIGKTIMAMPIEGRMEKNLPGTKFGR